MNEIAQGVGNRRIVPTNDFSSGALFPVLFCHGSSRTFPLEHFPSQRQRNSSLYDASNLLLRIDRQEVGRSATTLEVGKWRGDLFPM
jgi:hypothetical protein